MGIWDLTGHKVLDFMVRVKRNHEEGSGVGNMHNFTRSLCLLCDWIIRGKNGIRESREKVGQ